MNQNPEYSQSSEQNNIWRDFTQIFLVFVFWHFAFCKNVQGWRQKIENNNKKTDVGS